MVETDATRGQGDHQSSEMSDFIEVLDDHVRKFSRSPFFELLGSSGTLHDVRVMVPSFTFFVFAFQDALRLNESRFEHPDLQEIARLHRREDAGHEIWFLRDMSKLQISPHLSWVLGRPHLKTRDCGYAIVSEVLRARTDLERIAILIVLESTGDVFFSRVFRFFARAGVTESLEYFAKSHYEVECDHELFSPEHSRRVGRLTIAPKQRQEMLEMVLRMLSAMTSMVDAVYDRVVASRGSDKPVDAGQLPEQSGSRDTVSREVLRKRQTL